MATFSGADPDQLRSLSGAVANAAAHLEQTVSTLGVPATNPSVWMGTDADRFRSEWSSMIVPALRSVINSLHSASGQLNREAAEQENASSAGGVGGAGGNDPQKAPSGPVPNQFGANGGFAVSPEALRDLALFAAGKLSPDVASAAMVAGYLGQFDDLATSIGTGDGLGGANAAVGLAGSVLRDAPLGPAPQLFGSAMGLAQFIGEHAAEADFSQQGLNTVAQFIADDPGGALQGAGEGIVDNAAELLGLIPGMKAFHR